MIRGHRSRGTLASPASIVKSHLVHVESLNRRICSLPTTRSVTPPGPLSFTPTPGVDARSQLTRVHPVTAVNEMVMGVQHFPLNA